MSWASGPGQAAVPSLTTTTKEELRFDAVSLNITFAFPSLSCDLIYVYLVDLTYHWGYVKTIRNIALHNELSKTNLSKKCSGSVKSTCPADPVCFPTFWWSWGEPVWCDWWWWRVVLVPAGCGIQQSSYSAETSKRCLHSPAPPGRCSCEEDGKMIG